MRIPRRAFLKRICGTAAAGASLSTASIAQASHGKPALDEADGVLVDLTMCVGCRLCEYACRESNGFETGPLESYDDQSVFAQKRRPGNQDYTVVNAFDQPDGDGPLFAKINCMHCNEPACVSACIVGALEKQPDGSVTYDAWKCIGCRYCMVACPFQIPSYEYDNVLTPQVRKCNFCVDRRAQGEIPACVEACPRQALLFGKRNELLTLAHERIAANPQQYVDHVYGEHEVGGTSWMYLSPVPFDQAGMLTLGDAAPSRLTEAIQHGVFKYWIAPVALYGSLAAAAYVTRTRKMSHSQSTGHGDHASSHLHHRGDHAHHFAAVSIQGRAMVGAASGGGTVQVDMPEESISWQPRVPEPREHHPSRVVHVDHGHDHPKAAPTGHKLLTPGVWALIAMVTIGAAAGLYRFLFGLEASTHLDQQHPWGLWIAMDVGSGIALAGGGFVTAALVHVFHREHYHIIARSALVTALLGYTFYVPGLLADLGRWYNLWHPTLPNMWQVNSVLFEVGICVMIYLNVQYAELAPIICERFMSDERRPRLSRMLRFVHDKLERIMPVLLILGVTLSFFHQSSLGNLMVIAPYKLHPLWWTPVSPVMFLLSAMMVGFPVVIFTILFASRSMHREPPMRVLSPLSRYVPVFLTLYLGLKVGDMAYRGTWTYLLTFSPVAISWLVEMALVVLPLAMLLRGSVRRSPRWLGVACLAVILGVVLNRLNVFVIGYSPPFAERAYFPSLVEFALSMGLVAALLLVYRVMVTYLPVLYPQPPRKAASDAPTW